MSKRQQEMCYWGYRFEDYVTSTVGPSQPLPSSMPASVVCPNSEFVSVVRATLGTHRLLFAGEVDCVKAEPGSAVPAGWETTLRRTQDVCRNFLGRTATVI